MNLKHFQSLILPTLLALLLSGCDTGRGGMYKVRFTPPATVGTTAPAQPTDEERLKQLVRAGLAGKGFKELQGTPRRPGVWNRRGAWVELERDKDGELILVVRAFGSKRDVRVSERTEQELLAILKQPAELELTPVTPPKPPIN